MKDLKIHATDGDIGGVEDFYFDDEKWTIRYLVVNTGSWLAGRLVLISPMFSARTDWESEQLNLALTKEQIMNSPNIDMHQPVSRQSEADYLDYYGSSYYWGGSSMWGMSPYPSGLSGMGMPLAARTPSASQSTADSHLRSTSIVSGYRIETTDGDIGHVEDFLVDQETWTVRYLEVDTRNWLPGKKVLISTEWIENVSWLESKVSVALPRETIKSAPEYVESRPLTREYENQLHLHYGRPLYSVAH